MLTGCLKDVDFTSHTACHQEANEAQVSVLINSFRNSPLVPGPGYQRLYRGVNFMIYLQMARTMEPLVQVSLAIAHGSNLGHWQSLKFEFRHP